MKFKINLIMGSITKIFKDEAECKDYCGQLREQGITVVNYKLES
jgi:hypothetical protein